MPNRLVREGLIESEAVLSLPVDARWLYVVVILSADDLGLFEATEFKLARRADLNKDLAGRLMQMLSDADLVRLYVVDAKRYGFIPKFRQRVQIKSARHPLPPFELYQDDSDALKKINDLASNPTVRAPVGNGYADAGKRSEAEVEVKEEKVSVATQPRRQRKAADTPPCPFQAIVGLYHEALPELPAVRVLREGGRRKLAIKAFWDWVLTSEKSDGTRRAVTADQGLTWMRQYFERARGNDFLMGRTPKAVGHEDWECDLDFLLSEKGMKQVIEKTREAA